MFHFSLCLYPFNVQARYLGYTSKPSGTSVKDSECCLSFNFCLFCFVSFICFLFLCLKLVVNLATDSLPQNVAVWCLILEYYTILVNITQRHRRNTYINILLYTRDKMVDSKYINYNTNTYTNTYISIYYVIIRIFNTDILVSEYL